MELYDYAIGLGMNHDYDKEDWNFVLIFLFEIRKNNFK